MKGPPLDASQLKTKRDTIFGRGFIHLPSAAVSSAPSADGVVDSTPAATALKSHKSNYCMLMVSEFEIRILKSNQNKQEHSLLIEHISLNYQESDRSAKKAETCDAEAATEEACQEAALSSVPQFLIIVNVHDKETERFMPICHIAQCGANSQSLAVLETCLNSVKKEFGKFLRPNNIQVASSDLDTANNLAQAARKTFKADHLSVSQASFMICLMK